MQVADHHAKANATLSEYCVQAILLGCQLTDQFLPLARDQAQLAHHCGRDERPAQQSGPCEGGQPLCIADIGFASRDIPDMPGIDDQCTNACRLQCSIRTLKVKCPCFPSPLDQTATLPPIRPVHAGPA